LGLEKFLEKVVIAEPLSVIAHRLNEQISLRGFREFGFFEYVRGS
jgi:hypothetical protein